MLLVSGRPEGKTKLPRLQATSFRPWRVTGWSTCGCAPRTTEAPAASAVAASVALAAVRLLRELHAPVEPDDDQVGAASRGGDVGGDRRRVGGRGARPVGAGVEAERAHVGVAEQRDPQAARVEDRRPARQVDASRRRRRSEAGARARRASVSRNASRP